MEPVPTSFHIGPLVFHTYGFGLALAAYVAYRYAERRFARRELSTEPFARFTIIVLISALLGARAAHVATNWSLYRHNLIDVAAVWHGGLASFGGIAVAAPVGYVLARRWWPDTRPLVFTDALIPALIAGWALGRVLGPQFMVDGGGHLTHQWFGLRYAGQVGKRVPVPLIQSLEDGTLWLLIVGLEKKVGARRRVGVVSGVGCLIWGIVRSTDERLLLGQESHSGSVGVQIAGLVLAAVGLCILLRAATFKDTRALSEPAAVPD